MNNGNLLSSLLGATGASSAAAKSVVPKSRADTTEKFQQAFEQARPEVAARKPATRKEPDRQATEPRETPAKPDSRPEPISRAADHKKMVKPAENREPAEKEPTVKSQSTQEKTGADDQTGDESVEAVSTDKIEHQELDDASEGAQMVIDPSALIDVSESVAVVDDTAALIAAPVVTVQPAELINTEETAQVILPLTEEAGLDETDLLLKQDESIAAINPDTASPIAVSVAALPGVETTEDLAVIGVDIKTVGLNSLNPSSASNTVTAGNQSAASTGSLSMDDILPAAAQAEPSAETLVLAEGEGSDDVSLADNPDFALLNTKAGFNKMVESNLTSLDKAAAAAEPAKPVAATVSVLETLARPLESQSPAARAFVVQTGVPVTVGSPQWSQAVGDKVLWLAAQNVSAAEIRLDPPELGPMQVKVSVTQDQASVTFTSHNPAVRDALDQQLNRLREMFSEQGLNLVNVDVSDKSFAQQQRDQEDSGKSRSNADIEEDELMPVTVTQVASVRLVDHYA